MSFTNLENRPEKLYFDIQVENLNNISSLPSVLSFTETRNTPLLINPEDYYMSVIRFTLDTPTLPVITPSIQYNQANPNLTIYSVTLSWANPIAPFQQFNQQTYITFAPQDLATVVPVAPSFTPNKLQDNQTGYYYIYSYQYWIFLVNNTLTTCYNALNAQVVGAGLVLPTTHAPVMSFDTQRNIAILNCDILGYNDNIANHIEIFFNLPLYQLFSSFPIYILPLTAVLGKNIRISTNDFGNANTTQFPTTTPTYTAIQVFQEYSTIELWSSVRAIVFCSSTLPIIPTQVSAPVLIANGIYIGNNGNNSNQAPVITDMVVSDGLWKPSIVYEPSAQYRLISMTGNRPIYTVDISVYWKDTTGTLNNFRLGAGSGASIKLLFTRKDSINYKA